MTSWQNVTTVVMASACVVVLAGCASLGEASDAKADERASGVLLEQAAERPAGCPEPLPDGLISEEAEALAGKCMVPEVFSRFGGPGFLGGGLIDQHVSDDIFIYWHGEIDAGTQALIEEAAKAGIHVEVRPVPYSEEQLVEASVAIRKALEAAGIQVASVGLSFEDIEVTITDPLDQETAREIASLAAEAIPVTVVVGNLQLITGSLTDAGEVDG